MYSRCLLFSLDIFIIKANGVKFSCNTCLRLSKLFAGKKWNENFATKNATKKNSTCRSEKYMTFFFLFGAFNNSLLCFLKFWYFFAFVFCLVYTRLRELKKFDFLWKFDFLQNHSFERSLKNLICRKSGYEIFLIQSALKQTIQGRKVKSESYLLNNSWLHKENSDLVFALAL